MKVRVSLVVLCIALGLAASTSAFAQAITIPIDESNPVVILPFPVTPGPLIICEGPVAAGGVGCAVDISDELSFITQVEGVGPAFAMCLFSDPINAFGQPGTQEPPALGNTCPGSGFSGNFAYIPETGTPEVFEQMLYTPLPGQAGAALPGLPPVQYLITSDNGPDADVPEPASLTLFGTGVVGLAGVIRRRFRRTV